MSTGSHAVLCKNGDEAKILTEVLTYIRFIVSKQRHGSITVELAGKDDGSTKVAVSIANSTQTVMRGLTTE